MLARRLASLFASNPSSLRSHNRGSFSSTSSAGTGGKKSSFRRRAVPFVLLSLTGGVALSAVNDLAIFHGCSTKAIEKASQNQKVIEVLGVPIVRGPWYEATLAVGRRRQSVSCTFPVSGPQSSGSLQLRAVRSGEDTLFSFLRHHDYDILILEAILDVPSNDEMDRTVQISLMDDTPPTNTFVECKECITKKPLTSDN